MSQNKQIRILLVDDHAMVREGLRAFLQCVNDIEIAGEAQNGQEALKLVATEGVDVVLMDLVMPGGMDGIESTRAITTQFPSVRVIALTSFQDEDRVLQVLTAGAMGYLRKDVNPDDLLSAIRQAVVGRTVLEASAMNALRKNQLALARTDMESPASGQLSDRTEHRSGQVKTTTDTFGRNKTTSDSEKSTEFAYEALTKRELEILRWLAKGLSNKEIGSELGITEKTVKVHVSHILAKLGVYDRMQAVILASRIGLVQL